MTSPETKQPTPTSDKAVPNHVAIIMDGNGRWALSKGLPRVAGHRKGVENVREIITACIENNVSYLTLFAFSSENWRRPKREVSLLMELFITALDKEILKLNENDVRFMVVGDVEKFGDKLCNKIKSSEELTRKNKALTLTVAANYGGRWDIVQACRRVARKVAQGKLKAEDVTEEQIERSLSLYGIPDPDLFIRSGGEQRISNFLLWQLAYTELYFTEVLWPDFGKSEFRAALEAYSRRQRRFGFTGEQIEAVKHA